MVTRKCRYNGNVSAKSLVKSTFVTDLLHTRHCSRHWKQRHEWSRHSWSFRDKSTSIDLKMSQSKQGNWRERDIQMRSAYYEAGHGKEGLLVEEKAGARPQVGHDLVCLQKAAWLEQRWNGRGAPRRTEMMCGD